MDEGKIKEIAKATAKQFPTFGGGNSGDDGNPIEAALKNCPATFAMGVNVEEVVRFVVSAIEL